MSDSRVIKARLSRTLNSKETRGLEVGSGIIHSIRGKKKYTNWLKSDCEGDLRGRSEIKPE